MVNINFLKKYFIIIINNYKLELKELNYNKYKNIIKSLDLFIKKCENIEK